MQSPLVKKYALFCCIALVFFKKPTSRRFIWSKRRCRRCATYLTLPHFKHQTNNSCALYHAPTSTKHSAQASNGLLVSALYWNILLCRIIHLKLHRWPGADPILHHITSLSIDDNDSASINILIPGYPPQEP